MSEITEKRKSSAELKKEIEAAQKSERETRVKTDLKESGLPLVAGVAADINASNSTPEPKPATESRTEPAQSPAHPASEKEAAQSAALKDWAKKKGINWDTSDSVLMELRKKEQEFHAKRQADKERERQQQPQYPPYPPYAGANLYPPQAPYASTPQPMAPAVPSEEVLQNIARNYNITPEDAKRLISFNRDFFEVAIRNERQQWQQRMNDMERENQRNAVFRELSADPVFRRMDVAMEFHTVLDDMQSADPTSFEQDPNAYRRAYDRALVNIARRNLEGQPLQEGVPPQARSNESSLPTNPPRPLGQGSGGGQYQNENSIDPKEFAKLPLEEKRKYLDGMGLVQSMY